MGKWQPVEDVKREREKDEKKTTERKKRRRRSDKGRAIILKLKVVVQPDADDEFLAV